MIINLYRCNERLTYMRGQESPIEMLIALVVKSDVDKQRHAFVYRFFL